MRELLFGGILYLTGIGIILLLKPSIFFTESGDWKEFGIGRNPKSYTWMPFWLFCIFWALISYSIVFITLKGFSNTVSEIPMQIPDGEMPVINRSRGTTRGLRRSMKIPPAGFGNMQSGVYMLNQAASARNGIPHYVYYGPTMSGGGGGGHGGGGHGVPIYEYY